MTSTPKVAVQVKRTVKKEGRTLAFISCGINYKSKEVALDLYRTLLRPQLEGYVQFWSQHCWKDIIASEGMQRRFTRMLPGLDQFNHEESLDKLGLFSLEQRTLRGDLIKVYKIMRGTDG
eukprot:g18377.t1